MTSPARWPCRSGWARRAVVTADLNLADGAGRLAAFPYPLHHLGGQLHVRNGSVALDDVTMRQGGATLAVNGRVTWPATTQPGEPAGGDFAPRPDLTVAARDVPLDGTLLAVLPPPAQRFLRTAGLAGRLDVDGRITDATRRPTTAPADLPVDYDLDVALHDGTASPLGGAVTLTDVVARLGVRPDRIDVRHATARRGPAVLSAAGTVDLPDDAPAALHLAATARGLPLDRPLHDLLPASAAVAWDAIDPAGTVDADVAYSGIGSAPPTYRVTLRPLDLSARPAAFPYRLDHVTGSVAIDPATIDIPALHAAHGPATLALAGHGLTDHADRWDLTLSARGLPVDADLRRALPAGLRAAVAQTKLRGRVDLDLTTLNYRGGGAADPDAVNLDVAGTARAAGASMDVGVPLTQLDGGLTFATAVRAGHVAAFRGDLDLDTVALADRPLHHLRAHLEQPAGSDALHLSDVQGELAGGRLAGRIDLRFPTAPAGTTTPASGPAAGGYAVAFAVTDADVSEIAGTSVPGGQPLRGRLSASLDLAGDWNDPASRRGRGRRPRRRPRHVPDPPRPRPARGDRPRPAHLQRVQPGSRPATPWTAAASPSSSCRCGATTWS